MVLHEFSAQDLNPHLRGDTVSQGRRESPRSHCSKIASLRSAQENKMFLVVEGGRSFDFVLWVCPQLAAQACGLWGGRTIASPALST